MHKQPIVIAIDFDGTICNAEYPEVGEERTGAKYYINQLKEEGYMVVINTCREGRAAVKAMDFLDERGINYDYFNCNAPHLIELFAADCRKISADIYIDDKDIVSRVSGLPEWDTIYRLVKCAEPKPYKEVELEVEVKATEDAYA